MLLDSKNEVQSTKQEVDCCELGLRHAKDDYQNPRRTRFLIGNIFLKNFYSVYDYDQQEVRLGINIHSEGLASIHKYKPGRTWSAASGYE